MRDQRVLILAGPTGVGKTSMSIALAQRLDAEIISADSMQIYREMNIGTAKITKEEMQGIPHHLIDIVSPFESFTAFDFQMRAKEAMRDIQSRGKTAIVVGGTGLYINALLYDMDFSDTKEDPAYRKMLWELYEREGMDALYARYIAQVETPKIEKQNIKRVIRALEILHVQGELGDFESIAQNTEFSFDLYVLARERQQLYDNINRRVDLMLEQGLLNEVERLRAQGLTREHQSMKGIGYRQILAHLEGECTLDEAVEAIKQESRRYAKRQLTWFRRYKEAIWMSPMP